MGIALITFDSLFAPLQGLARWLVPQPGTRGARPAMPLRPAAQGLPASRAHPPRAALHPSARPVRRPLRVVRVVEACPAPTGAGRMVISGRMADVCAELDRLAALEAAAVQAFAPIR